MFKVEENVSLKSYNTFGIDVKARYLAEASSADELKSLLKNYRKYFPFLIVGGGSNIVFTKDFNGLVIHPAIMGIEIVGNSADYCYVKVNAGVEWDFFVNWAVDNNLGGIENLSLIPGSTGSSPIQNIGAYGAEAKDVIEKVTYLELETLEEKSITNSECRFGYRNSIFKNQLKNRTVIISVTFRLKHNPEFNISYGNLKEEVDNLGEVSLRTIRESVIKIRNSKLPDPAIIGNSGSFFKNPVVSITVANDLKAQYESLPGFKVSEDEVKIPAGWLIEKCGWKGRKIGGVGVHEKQALVLINNGGATGKEVVDLANQIKKSVSSKFGINLEPEVNII